MISYLSMYFTREPVPHDQLSHLPNLVRLGLVPVALEIDHLGDTSPAEQMMATTGPFDESQSKQEASQIVEPNPGVGIASQNCFQRLGRAHVRILTGEREIYQSGGWPNA